MLIAILNIIILALTQKVIKLQRSPVASVKVPYIQSEDFEGSKF